MSKITELRKLQLRGPAIESLVIASLIHGISKYSVSDIEEEIEFL